MILFVVRLRLANKQVQILASHIRMPRHWGESSPFYASQNVVCNTLEQKRSSRSFGCFVWKKPTLESLIKLWFTCWHSLLIGRSIGSSGLFYWAPRQCNRSTDRRSSPELEDSCTVNGGRRPLVLLGIGKSGFGFNWRIWNWESQIDPVSNDEESGRHCVQRTGKGSTGNENRRRMRYLWCHILSAYSLIASGKSVSANWSLLRAIYWRSNDSKPVRTAPPFSSFFFFVLGNSRSAHSFPIAVSASKEAAAPDPEHFSVCTLKLNFYQTALKDILLNRSLNWSRVEFKSPQLIHPIIIY